MSLFEFPPLNTTGRPYSIQEYNGEILTGTEDEFLGVNKCRALMEFPSIDKIQLSGLRHCISKDNMKNVFATGEGGMIDSAWNQLISEGLSGVVRRLTDAAEPTKLWPVAKIGRGVLKVHNVLSRMIPIKCQEKMEDLVENYGTTLNWKTNWIRCLSIHPTGARLAICQADDYIRVFSIGKSECPTPITLKHERQQNVTGIEWQPHDQRVLAVSAENIIIIWKLAAKSMNIRPSGQCVRIISTTFSVITSITWDRYSSRSLFVASPESNKILAVDTTNEEIEHLGSAWSWEGGSITRLVASEDGGKIAALYTSNMLKVFDRISWDCQKFCGLKGRPVDAVWSPNSEFLIFATDNSPHLHSISLVLTDESVFKEKNERKWIASGPIQQIFDVSPVEFDSSEAEIQGGQERPIIEIGGRVHRLALSPDGKRLAVSFRKNSTVVATFSVEWGPTVRLSPCGLLEAPNFGSSSIISFLPKFNEGSLLSIVWSDGYVQYFPFIYTDNASMMIPITNILDEISGTHSGLNNNSRRRSINDSLRSDTLPSGIMDRSDVLESPESAKKSRLVL